VIDLPPGVRLVLASASPRRSELLRQFGVPFDIRPADIDETVRPDEDPVRYVRRLSIEKAAAVVRPADIVIAADTTVEIDGQILGKPADDTEARRMLTLLSAATHRVHTGVTIRLGDDELSHCVTTEVTFVDLSPAAVDWYVSTGESFDKAGGYALQGVGGVLVAQICGSVSNVIGLPLAETVALLHQVVRLPAR
jgi:septum formation protein